MEITSNQNTTYKQWMKLHQAKYRSEYRRFLVEGEHLVEEALKAKCVEAIIIRYGHKTSYKGTIYELKDNLFDKLCVTQSKENIIALCTFPSLNVKNETRLLICDQIQDPGNMGTMIRTALSFGFDKILCSKDCVDVYNEKVIRASQGAMFHIVTESVDCVKSIEDLKKSGFKVYGTGFNQSIPLESVKPNEKLAVVLGNEGKGVRVEVLRKCDSIIRIETSKFNSLNVGVATGILLHYFRK